MSESNDQHTPSGPDSPAAALVGDLVFQARDRSLNLLIGALGHLLRQQSWARERLAAHAGRTVRIAVAMKPIGALEPPEVRATIDASGLLQRADPTVEPDATLRIEPSTDALFSLLGEGPQGLQRHLRIEGEVRLAATLGELAQHLRWDAEEDLSRVVGDVAAHRIVRFAGQALARLRDLGTRAETSAAQFAATGSQVAVKPQIERFRERVSALDHRLQALEKRVAGLGSGQG